MESDPLYQKIYAETCEVYRRYKRDVVDRLPPFETMNVLSSDDEYTSENDALPTPPLSPYTSYPGYGPRTPYLPPSATRKTHTHTAMYNHTADSKLSPRKIDRMEGERIAAAVMNRARYF